MMLSKWKRCLEKSRKQLSEEEYLLLVLSELLKEEDPARLIYLLAQFQEHVEPKLTKILLPHLREVDDPAITELIIGSIIKKFAYDMDSIIYLANFWPYSVPFLIARLPSQPAEVARSLVSFLVSPQWTSPLGPEPYMELVNFLPNSSFPELLVPLIKKIQVGPCTMSVIISKVLSSPGGLQTLQLVDSILLFCKRTEHLVLPYLKQIYEKKPNNQILDLLISIFLITEPISSDLLEVFKGFEIPKFILDISDQLQPSEELDFTGAACADEFESEELCLVSMVVSKGYPELPNSVKNLDTFTAKLYVILKLRQFLIQPSMSIKCLYEALKDQLDPLQMVRFAVWNLSNRPSDFNQTIRQLILIAQDHGDTRKTIHVILENLMLAPNLIERILPIICKALPLAPFLFPLIQAFLPVILSPENIQFTHNQVLLAVCVWRVAQADRKQTHLNCAFKLVNDFLHTQKETIDPLACSMIFSTLLRLIRIKYIDPKIVWKSFVTEQIQVSPEPEVIGVLCSIAYEVIKSHKLNYDEPIPDQVALLFNFIKTSLFASKSSFVLDFAGRALLNLDPLYFGEAYPTSTDLYNHVKKAKVDFGVEHGLMLLLKSSLDKEIADMPRSLFLGTGASPNKSNDKSNDEDNGLFKGRFKAISAGLQSNPNLLPAFLIMLPKYLTNLEDDSEIKSILTALLDQLRSLMQQHWSTRLTINDLLTSTVHVCVQKLAQLGKLKDTYEHINSVLDKSLKCDSPSGIAAAILLRTALELGKSGVSGDMTAVRAWSSSYQTSFDPQFAENEEIMTAVILSSHMMSLPPPNTTKSKWITFMTESLSDSQESSQLIVADNFDQAYQMLKNCQISDMDDLEIAKTIHARLMLAEPAETKNVLVILISKAIWEEEVAMNWAKHLIQKLEKPAPAIIKADAAIGLVTLFKNSLVPGLILKFKASLRTILPALNSSTSDSRLNAWYSLLLAQSLSEVASNGPSHGESEDNRFGKSTFGLMIDDLKVTKNPTVIYRLLAMLKTVPRLSWTLDPAHCQDFVLAHVCTALPSGGHYIHPDLLACLRLNIDKFYLDSFWRMAHHFIPHLDASVQAELIQAALKPNVLFEALQSCNQMNLSPPAQLLSPILPMPTSYDDQSWIPIYGILSTAYSDEDIFEPWQKAIIDLIRAGNDLKKIVECLKSDPSHESDVPFHAAVLLLTPIPEAMQADLLVRILDLTIIDPKRKHSLKLLIEHLVLRWLDPVRQAIIGDPGLAWKSYELTLEPEDQRRLRKRLLL